MSSWSRLVRFIPKSGGSPLIGEPVDPSVDVGLANYQGEQVMVNVFSGKSILDAGERTSRTEEVEQLLSPLAESEVGTIRGIGLNVSSWQANDIAEGSTTPMRKK